MGEIPFVRSNAKTAGPVHPILSMKNYVTAVLLSLAAVAATAAKDLCANDASEQAKRLLAFHMGDGFQDRMSFDSPSPTPPIRSPANSKQVFKVLEIDGYISPHGRYRMRFLFYPLPSGCLLMGQEILEIANL